MSYIAFFIIVASLCSLIWLAERYLALWILAAYNLWFVATIIACLADKVMPLQVVYATAVATTANVCFMLGLGISLLSNHCRAYHNTVRTLWLGIAILMAIELCVALGVLS